MCRYLTFSVLALISHLSWASCKDVLDLASRNYYSQYSYEDLKAFMYHKACNNSESSSSSSTSLTIEAVANNTPLKGIFGSGSSKESRVKWCKENTNLNSKERAYLQVNNEVFLPAINSWESCKLAEEKGLSAKTVISGDGSLIQTELVNKTANDQKLLGITISADDMSSISCRLASDSENFENVNSETIAMLERGKTVTITCSRKPISVVKDEYKLNAYSRGAISVSNVISPYLFSFPTHFIDFPPTKIVTQPEKFVVSLSGTLAATRGRWSAHKKHRDFEAPLEYLNMTFVEWDSRRSVNIGKRKGAYALVNRDARDFCDGAGESCVEMYYSKACLVNNSWLSWYREKIKRESLPYSKEQVCSLDNNF